MPGPLPWSLLKWRRGLGTKSAVEPGEAFAGFVDRTFWQGWASRCRCLCRHRSRSGGEISERRVRLNQGEAFAGLVDRPFWRGWPSRWRGLCLDRSRSGGEISERRVRLNQGKRSQASLIGRSGEDDHLDAGPLAFIAREIWHARSRLFNFAG